MKHRQIQNETSSDGGLSAVVHRMKSAARVRTDAELAEFVEVPRPTVASWKRRGSVPQPALLRLAMKTGCTMEWLITGQGERKDDSFLLPAVDAEILAIAIHRAERWWQEFDKGKCPASASELAYVIATFYAQTEGHFSEWRHFSKGKRSDTLAALRKMYGLPERQAYVGPWDERIDLQKSLDEAKRLLNSLVG